MIMIPLGVLKPLVNIVAPSAGYLTNLIPTAEGMYRDYSLGIGSTTDRALYTTTGVDIDQLHTNVGTTTYPCNPTVSDINSALVTASNAGGGIVVPTATTTLSIDSDEIFMQDNTILDGSNIGTVQLLLATGGSDRVAAVRATEKEWFAVTNFNIDGGGELNYGVRADECQNYLFQNITCVDHDQNCIRLSTKSRNVTVRYCDLTPGTEAQGNGTQRNQHGIVAGQVAPPTVDAATVRFGLQLNINHAYYSNIIRDTDGNSIDFHGGNLEVCGNYTSNSGFGPKFPNSTNVLSHNNYWGVASNTGNSIGYRLYDANDMNAGELYKNDRFFIFDDIFDVGASRNIRFDGIHGDVYLIDNTYTSGNLVAELSSSGSTVPNSFNGTLHRHGADASQSITDTTGGKVVALTDTQLQAKDVASMIVIMNSAQDSNWAAYSNYPLPTMVAR